MQLSGHRAVGAAQHGQLAYLAGDEGNVPQEEEADVAEHRVAAHNVDTIVGRNATSSSGAGRAPDRKRAGPQDEVIFAVSSGV